MKVIPRDAHTDRYKKVALIVDGSQKALTPDTSDWVSGPFNMLDHSAESTLTGKEFKLDWTKDGDSQYAQLKFIEIDYIISQASGWKSFLSREIKSWFLLFKYFHIWS